VESHLLYHHLCLGHFQLELEREENEVDPAAYMAYTYRGFLASEARRMARVIFQIDER
jgi:hypothetical protein